MIHILKRLFTRNVVENEDENLGFDMAPAPSVMALTRDPQEEGEGVLSSVSSMAGGPFTTMAQAPIRDG